MRCLVRKAKNPLLRNKLQHLQQTKSLFRCGLCANQGICCTPKFNTENVLQYLSCSTAELCCPVLPYSGETAFPGTLLRVGRARDNVLFALPAERKNGFFGINHTDWSRATRDRFSTFSTAGRRTVRPSRCLWSFFMRDKLGVKWQAEAGSQWKYPWEKAFGSSPFG